MPLTQQHPLTTVDGSPPQVQELTATLNTPSNYFVSQHNNGGTKTLDSVPHPRENIQVAATSSTMLTSPSDNSNGFGEGNVSDQQSSSIDDQQSQKLPPITRDKDVSTFPSNTHTALGITFTDVPIGQSRLYTIQEQSNTQHPR